jgi:hemolysin activation/secretion protein
LKLKIEAMPRTAFRGRRTALAAALLGLLGIAQAQVLPPSADPGVIQQRNLELDRRAREQDATKAPSPGAPLNADKLQPADPAKPRTEARFTLTEIAFPKSAFLDNATLSAIAGKYVGREVTLAELNVMVRELNAAYKERGALAAQAIVPPQDIVGGRLRVDLVEGKVGGFTFKGADTTSTTFIRGHLPAVPGEVVDVARLEEGVVRFNRLYDAQVGVELQPGDGFGMTNLEITVSEPPRHGWRVGYDNYGSEATGVDRVTLAYTLRSPLGRRDELGVNVDKTKGGTGLGLTYAVPIDYTGGRVSASVRKDHNRIIAGIAAPLGLVADSDLAELRIQKPIALDSKQFGLAWTGGLRWRQSEATAQGVLIQEARSSEANLGLESQAQLGAWATGGALTIHSGKVRAITDRSYSVLRGGFYGQASLTESWGVRFQGSFQHSATDALPAQEQFFIGGIGSVRGYDSSAVGGDHGANVSLELQRQILSEEGRAILGFAFLDRGIVRVWDSVTQDHHGDGLTSVGVGANWQWGKAWTGRVTYGRGLHKRPGVQSDKLYFQATWAM